MTTASADPSSEILSLEGSGYKLLVSAETEAAKAELIESAALVTQVTNNDESSIAQRHVRNLAAFRNQVEKARVEVKKPVLDLGRKIDAAAGEFVAIIAAEESRLKLMVGNHAEQLAAEKRRAEAEERRKLDEAKKAKEAAELAEREAEAARLKLSEAKSITEVIAAKQETRKAEEAAKLADQQKIVANRERLAVSGVVAATNVTSGVRFEIDFEVEDAAAFYAEQPGLCEITVPRGQALAWLKRLKADGIDVVKLGPEIGLKVSIRPVVSTR